LYEKDVARDVPANQKDTNFASRDCYDAALSRKRFIFSVNVSFNASPAAIYPFEVRVTSNRCELSRLLFSLLTRRGVTGMALDGLFFPRSNSCGALKIARSAFAERSGARRLSTDSVVSSISVGRFFRPGNARHLLPCCTLRPPPVRLPLPLGDPARSLSLDNLISRSLNIGIASASL